MNFVRLYGRVIRLLKPEARLAWILAIANILLAAAQFAEPVLFGRIVDALVKTQAANAPPDMTALTPLLGAWVGFGLFTIACSVLVALHSDRLSHRRKQAVLTNYFEHVLQLPISFHGGTHSGRLMKVMLTGVDALWGLWLSFFREHFAAFIALFVLLPLSLLINWQLASILVVLTIVFTGLTALVVRKTDQLQGAVESHYTALAERTSDALTNIALVQGFARVEAEVTNLRSVVNKLLAAQMPVLSWWAMIAVLTRSATTMSMLAIFLLGIWLNSHGQATIGEIVTFMNFAALLVVRLEQVVGFSNKVLMDAPRLREFFEVLDTVPAVRDRADAIDPGRLRGMVEFNDVSFSYDGKRPAVADLSLHGAAGRNRRDGRHHRRRQVDRARAAAPRLRPAVRRGQDRRHGHQGDQACVAAPQHRRGVSGSAPVQSLGRREPARWQPGCDRRAAARSGRARAGDRPRRAARA
jgi:ATP-binding cassette subfamily B protein